LRDDRPELTIIVGVLLKGVPHWEVDDNLDELEQLVMTAGGEVVGRVVQSRPSFDSATLIGTGKLQELAGLVEALSADLVVFDDDLTPAQSRNLQEKLECKILDRSGIILDIFAMHARTKEAKIQVEVAQLEYLLPRLTRRWKHLSRQFGGIGTRGPVGSKGPGETQLEIDKRVIGRRLSQLQDQLTKIEVSRTVRRHRRRDIFKTALIGYTNAGKSTLLNALTRSNVFVEDRLFATLDPTVRGLRLEDGNRILLIDTVGFIRKLPVGLLASFKSTLEESRQADLFVHLVDLSHPHWEGQMARTEEILRELKLHHVPQVLTFNKIDQVEDQLLIEGLSRQHPSALFISASRGIRLYELVDRIQGFANQKWVRDSRSFKTDQLYGLEQFEGTIGIKILSRTFSDGMIVVDYLRPARPDEIENTVEE